MLGHRDVPSKLDAMIARELHLGYSDDERIVEDATEQFPDHGEPVVRAALAAALEKRAIEERGWPETTDCDRLDSAFAALEAEGVVARQSFWCCTSCAIPAIKAEMMDEEARGTAVRGYVYFHWGMLDDVASGGPLGLQCGGAIADDDSAHGRIVERVVAALKRAGLAAEGRSERTVEVALDWKKRRRAPPRPDDAKSIEEHVAAWERAFATAILCCVPNMFPIELGPALVSVGAGALAARLASRSTRAGMADITARALAGAGEEALAREVLLAAYRRHPSVDRRWDNDLTTALTRDPALSYIALLLRGGLSDDVVARVAVARISPLPPTIFAAAAKAWLACLMREAGRPISKYQEDRWIGDSRAVWSYDERTPYEGRDAREGRVLLAAALWSYLTPEESEGYTDPAFGWLWSSEELIEKPQSLARRGAFRACAIANDLEARLDEVEGGAVPDLMEEMIAAGEIDMARALLPKIDGDDRTLALIALGELPSVDVNATKERIRELETSYQDCLITYAEWERGPVVAAHALAASGDPESALALLTASLEEKVAESKAEVAAARATLDQAAAASFEIDWTARAQDVSPEWTPTDERRLESTARELTAPEAQGLMQVRQRMRSLSRLLVKLAAVDRERSSKIFDDVVDRWGVGQAWWGECVTVMMAVGRLDEALKHDRAPEAPSMGRRSMEIARLLLLAGRRDDALERLIAFMAKGAWPRELLDVGLMLLSLAPPEKRPAIAARLRAAYDRAIVVLDELAPPPQAAPCRARLLRSAW
ncbi:hypothetical protein [Polyangium sp. 15x6]|uniref:DUF6891 domain-containing protein n=1 Tax=Polyangium sp. 15x6 TaxID=3042687 RepID=UPI002499E151|nr:hypothetical protein [Polyangium sp. 15x6]MDI3291623.1 hypothetical protein [Polyangium sp. 15x6]